MTIPSWSAELSVGIPEMDRSHASMLASLQQLAGLPDAAFPEAFARLVADVEQDFAGEEAMMEEIDFPGLHSHLEQHARVLSGLHHAMPRVQEGDTALARQVLELLPQWFIFHISTMDMALAMAALACGWTGAEPPVPSPSLEGSA